MAEDQDAGILKTTGDTVGAVALDKYDNLAAACSTGGLTNKLSGRIGNSPNGKIKRIWLD